MPLITSKHTSKHKSKHKGFSLIESVVALGLMASVGLALLSWVQSSQGMLISARIAERERALTQTVIAEIRRLDLTKEPKGEAEFGDWRFRYVTSQIATERDALGLANSRRFRVQLFQVDASVNYGTPGQIDYGEFTIKFQQVGER